MRNEAEFCTVIGKSFNWYHKISDGGRHGQLPFDGFSIWNGKPVYWEAKFSKQPESFNLQRIEDHQLENLMTIKHLCPQALCWIILGVNFGRNDIRCYIFDNLDELKNRRIKRRNYLKKDLITMPYFKIKKGVIDFNNLITPNT